MQRRTWRSKRVDRIVGRNLKRRMRVLKIGSERMATALQMPEEDLLRVLAGQERLHATKIYDASLFLNLPFAEIFDQPALRVKSRLPASGEL